MGVWSHSAAAQRKPEGPGILCSREYSSSKQVSSRKAGRRRDRQTHGQVMQAQREATSTRPAQNKLVRHVIKYSYYCIIINGFHAVHPFLLEFSSAREFNYIIIMYDNTVPAKSLETPKLLARYTSIMNK